MILERALEEAKDQNKDDTEIVDLIMNFASLLKVPYN